MLYMNAYTNFFRCKTLPVKTPGIYTCHLDNFSGDLHHLDFSPGKKTQVIYYATRYNSGTNFPGGFRGTSESDINSDINRLIN